MLLFCLPFATIHRYVQAWQILDACEAATGKQVLTLEEREWVLGGTVASLFPGAWGAWGVPADKQQGVS